MCEILKGKVLKINLCGHPDCEDVWSRIVKYDNVVSAVKYKRKKDMETYDEFIQMFPGRKSLLFDFLKKLDDNTKEAFEDGR